jgi:hypothetical protein
MPLPPHLPNPPKDVTRKVWPEDAAPAFKRSHKGLTRPTPSIATNMRNLKSSFPSAFSGLGRF